jgi:WhiB family transcriptional regulator, redox-sensing transcriptional regulator
MEKAKCKGMNQELFFGKEYLGRQRHRPTLTSIEIRRAKAICAVCPVLQDCFDHAMEQDEEYGVWGGTTFRERQRLRAANYVSTTVVSGSL